MIKIYQMNKKMRNNLVKSVCLVMVMVFLTAFNSTKEFALPTSLKITVLDELGNIVEGATVVLFTTEEDYKAETNPITVEEKTDKKGRVTFKNLDPKSYYVLASYKDKSNIGAGVLTAPLLEGKSNRVNTIIE